MDVFPNNSKKTGATKKIKSKSFHHSGGSSDEELSGPVNKIVIRRLPPDMTFEKFKLLVSPIPPHDYMYFVEADYEYGRRYAFSRAYISFIDVNDLNLFKEKYDDFVFLSAKGQEYRAVVEFAPFQHIPKTKSSRHIDKLCGTITDDYYYKKFVKSLSTPEPPAAPYLEVMELNKDDINKKNDKNVTTPLLEYIAAKRQEKINIQQLWKNSPRNNKIETCTFYNSSLHSKFKEK